MVSVICFKFSRPETRAIAVLRGPAGYRGVIGVIVQAEPAPLFSAVEEFRWRRVRGSCWLSGILVRDLLTKQRTEHSSTST